MHRILRVSGAYGQILFMTKINFELIPLFPTNSNKLLNCPRSHGANIHGQMQYVSSRRYFYDKYV